MSHADAEQYIEERDVWTDPISHRPVDAQTAEHQSFYAGHMYHFESLVNKQEFDEDPQLWVPTPHASPTSAHLSATGEPQ